MIITLPVSSTVDDTTNATTAKTKVAQVVTFFGVVELPLWKFLLFNADHNSGRHFPFSLLSCITRETFLNMQMNVS